jgi:hypothetical protein
MTLRQDSVRRNECWENVFEEKQARSSESGGWGMGIRMSIAPLIGRSLELSLADLALNGYWEAARPGWSCSRR